ncbi:SCO6880 family protein [Corynebacterium sp. AOP40-9SA-29]|uniref:SCO6880 family protein n=1 Tax=Corynebacterium sp. AOP40-9SA-29 TaxID=3457677 RepID=UPI0040332EBB
MATATKEAQTYTLGRKSERNFIGRLPARTAIVLGSGLVLFLPSMFLGQIKFAVLTLVITAGVAALVHFKPGGRSLPERTRIRVESRWRSSTGEDTFLSGPDSKIPGGQYRLPGALSATEMIETTDAVGRTYGIIVNPLDKTATVLLTGQLTGDVLRSVEEQDMRIAQWGRCEALWSQNTELESVVSVVDTRPATGMLVAREVDTIIDKDAPAPARDIMYEKAAVLHQGVQELDFHAAFTVKVPMSHRQDYSFAEQLSYQVPEFYRPLAWAGIDARPMTSDEISATAHSYFTPGSEADFEQLRVQHHGHGMAWRDAGPSTAAALQQWYFHDGAYSRTWEMREGPKATFEQNHLAPLLRPHDRVLRKKVALVFRPYAPGEAQNLVDAEHKDAMVGVNNGKGIKSADAQLRLEATEAARQALARGAQYGRRSLYVSATAMPDEDRRAITADIKAMAAQCSIKLTPMDRMTDAAFVFSCGLGALPFGKTGLRSGR